MLTLSSPTLAVMTPTMMWKKGTASIIIDPFPPLRRGEIVRVSLGVNTRAEIAQRRT